jgi:hypothetical protein
VLLDCISPWHAAMEAADAAAGCAAFRRRHQQLLEDLRRQRTPFLPEFPLASERVALGALARRVSDPAFQQQWRDQLLRAEQLGADGCGDVVLLAGDGRGDAAEPLPWPAGAAALFPDCADDDTGLTAALARAVAALTRWCARDSDSPIRVHAAGRWDRWALAQQIPLREWLYTEGLGVHLLIALLPELPIHRVIGVSRAAFTRLREQENLLQALLAVELDQSGLGLLLRWLATDAPPGARRIGRNLLPPMAGRYLSWKMLSRRVARAGLRDAIRMEA